MSSAFRESIIGQAINHVTKGRVLPYPEQRSDFIVPARYVLGQNAGSLPSTAVNSRKVTPLSVSPTSTQSTRAPSPTPAAARTDSDNATLADVDVADGNARKAIEKALNTEKQQVGMEQGEDPYLVTWYGEDDPDNPQNWSNARKGLLLGTTMLLTFSVYIGSAIYTPSIPGVMERFNVSQTKAILGLALYVLGYGIGPMFLSPLSEIPSIGRLNVYLVSLGLFVLLQIPTALAPNYSTLMAMRFLAGVVCSPALSTGGATLADVFKPMTIPYVTALWSAGAVAGPVFGPVAGGFAAMKENWRWPLYILLFLSLFCFIVLSFTFPETSAATILLRRARRLRKLTGNDKLRSQSEIDQADISPTALMSQALIRPFVLLLEPAVFMVDLYIALVYAIFYLWFESFAIVYTGIYHFNLGLSGLPFLGFIVALVPTLLGYFAYQKYSVIPEFKRTGTLIPESRLKVAIFGSFFIPFALLTFGWTARASVHWIVSIIFASTYLFGIFYIFQGAIVYLPLSYQSYAASVLAGNALLRGITGAVFPLFAHAFFDKLGVGGGSSLLAGLSIIMIPPLFALYKYGAKLRAMSKYATS